MNQFTVRITVPSDQVGAFEATMEQWVRMTPTIWFLDICSISHIKDYIQNQGFKDKKHEDSIQALRKIDHPQHKVAYISALMEKASDQRSTFSAQDFVDEARRDWDAIKTFFVKASMVEPWDFVKAFVGGLFGAHAEQAGPAYLAFLQFANDRGLHSVTPEGKRLKVAEELCAKAQALGINTGHPVVLVPIARVYGCEDARKVLKFAGTPENFNPGNALGDIQWISRFAGTFSALIRQSGAQYKTGFATADSPLQNILRYFTVKSVKSEMTPNGISELMDLSIDEPALFPDLFGDDRQPKNETCEAELRQLHKLLEAYASPANAAARGPIPSV